MSHEIDWNEINRKLYEGIDVEEFYREHLQKATVSGNTIQGLCPFHEDNNPSLSAYLDDGRFKCFAGSCGEEGSIFDFLAKIRDVDFFEAKKIFADSLGIDFPVRKKKPGPKPGDPPGGEKDGDLFGQKSTGKKKKKKPQPPPIDPKLALRWHESLLNTPSKVKFLNEIRGIKNESLKKFMVGWDGERFTIPVYDEKGKIRNVRRYDPTAPRKFKILNYTTGEHKYGSPVRLMGLYSLHRAKQEAERKGDERVEVVICEGEWDCILLNQEGFRAITSTHGSSSFRRDWGEILAGCDVVLAYDCDESGKKGVQEKVIPVLYDKAHTVKRIDLPLEGSEEEKDITDFFVKKGGTQEDFRELITNAEIVGGTARKVESAKKQEGVIRIDSFRDIDQPEYIDKRVETEITICGQTSHTYHAIEEFEVVNCKKISKGTCCQGAGKRIEIPFGAEEYIQSCMSTNAQVTGMLRNYACPSGSCPHVEPRRKTTMNELFAHQKVDRIVDKQSDGGSVIRLLDGKQQDLVEKRVYYKGDSLDAKTYLAQGYVRTHPKTQEVTFICDKMEPQEDDYEKFDLEENKEHLEELRKLSLEEIVADLSKHVTRIYRRDHILLSVLLTYLSPLRIPFNKETIRGWITTSICGDVGTGKTQTFERISDFIGVGDIFSGLTGSRTGLTYGMIDHKMKGWTIRTGRYAENSRKIMAIDETQHLKWEDLNTIGKAMDEGWMKIDRIARGGYETMTRLICLSNPKDGKTISSFFFPVVALKDIFSDFIIRRFDIAVFASQGDIDKYEMMNRPVSGETGKVTSDMLRSLVYLAWNLKTDQIQFEADAEEACLVLAKEMSDTFGWATDVLLVSPSDFRKTLARVAASLAVLSCSFDSDWKNLIVTKEHVEWVCKFFYAIYRAKNCRLKAYSDKIKKSHHLSDANEIRDYFEKKIYLQKHSPNGKEGAFEKIICLMSVKGHEGVRVNEISSMVGCGDDTVRRVLSSLKGFSLVESDGRNGYKITPKFVQFLIDYEDSNPDFFRRGEYWIPDAEAEQDDWSHNSAF